MNNNDPVVISKYYSVDGFNNTFTSRDNILVYVFHVNIRSLNCNQREQGRTGG